MSDNWTRLIETAYPMFMEKGYKGTATADIAKTAEINESTLFRNFKSKEKLFHASIEHFANKAIGIDFNIFEYTGNLHDDLKRMIKTMFEVDLELIPSFRLLIKRSLVKESVLKDISKALADQNELFSHYLTGAMRRGLMVETESNVLVDLISSYVFSRTFELLTTRDQDSFSQRLEDMVEATTVYFKDMTAIREVKE